MKKNNYFHDYSVNTSLHGIKYIANCTKPLHERMFWILMVVVSFTLCVLLVNQVWHNWDENPIITSFDEHLTPVWKIPFPAVTICPMAVTQADKFNFSSFFESEFENKSESVEAKNMFDLVSVFCQEDTELHTKAARVVSSMIILEKLKNISLRHVDVFPRECQFLGEKKSSDAISTKILTDIGFCFTINMLNAKDIYSDAIIYDKTLPNKNNIEGWNMDEGYPKNSSYFTYPQRAKGSGKASGLNVVLMHKRNNTDIHCNGIYKGFAVHVHPPYALPKNTKNFIYAPYESDFSMVVTPKVIYTSEHLKIYKPEKRQCYFSDERKLKFFKNYSRENCETECITNFTMVYCGCVSPGMPRDDSMPMCAGGSKSCLEAAMVKISVMDNLHEIPRGVWKEGMDERNSTAAAKIASECNCLQSCNSISYHVAVNQVKLNWIGYLKNDDKSVRTFAMSGSNPFAKKDPKTHSKMVAEPNGGVDYSLLSVYIDKPYITMTKRSERYGTADFLANCGGLIGVCLGFSLLSLVEIVYFFGVRLISNLMKRRANGMVQGRQSDAWCD